MLGIIIGIAAVIAVIAVGLGATVMIQTQMSSLGDNLMMISPGSTFRGGFHHGAGTRSTLTAQDGEAILEECLYVKSITPVIRSGGQLVYKEKNWPGRIEGVAPSYLEIRNWQVEKGCFLAESDVRSAIKVCVLGATISKELFDNEDPIGKMIRIKNMPFRIIGVLEKKGSTAWGRDQDDTVIMPWTTVRRVIQSSPFNDVNRLVGSLVSIKIFE
ncbi:unnamed protein product, partial [marine sediment metagenome]